MTAVQQHGIDLENLIITAYQGGLSSPVSNTCAFDIPADLAREGSPVSIKSCKIARNGRSTVCLGDARRVWRGIMDNDFIFIIAPYRQIGHEKVFAEVFEMRIDPSMAKGLLGDIHYEAVADFHNGITSFKSGEHARARSWAKGEKKELMALRGAISLNPKIDSRNQRRLQCSVGLQELLMMGSSRRFADKFGRQALPFKITSPSRDKERLR